MITIDVKDEGIKRNDNNLIIDINKIIHYETYSDIDKTRVQANSGNRASVFTNQCITCKYNSKNDCKMYKDCEHCPNQINDSCNCLCRPFVNERNCIYYKEYKQDNINEV